MIINRRDNKELRTYRKSNITISTRINDAVHETRQFFTLMNETDHGKRLFWLILRLKYLHRRLLNHPYRKQCMHKLNRKSDSLYGNTVSLHKIHFYVEDIDTGSKMLKSKTQIQHQCSPSPENHQKWWQAEWNHTQKKSANNHFTCNE